MFIVEWDAVYIDKNIQYAIYASHQRCCDLMLLLSSLQQPRVFPSRAAIRPTQAAFTECNKQETIPQPQSLHKRLKISKGQRGKRKKSKKNMLRFQYIHIFS